jgi:hypothetical protein
MDTLSGPEGHNQRGIRGINGARLTLIPYPSKQRESALEAQKWSCQRDGGHAVQRHTAQERREAARTKPQSCDTSRVSQRASIHPAKAGQDSLNSYSD